MLTSVLMPSPGLTGLRSCFPRGLSLTLLLTKTSVPTHNLDAAGDKLHTSVLRT